MKRGVLFVNTARDTLVDEAALYDALASGRVAGAALDLVNPPDLTLPPELGRRHRLLDHPNVILAPHIGGATYETLLHGGEMVAAEIERLIAGTPLVNVANRAALAGTAGRRRDEPRPRHRPWHRQLPGHRLRRRRQPGRPRPSASGPTRACPACRARRSSTPARNWQLIATCCREAIDRSGVGATGIAAVSATSMREGMVLYDRDGREIWACPNVDSRAAAEADRARPERPGAHGSSRRAGTGSRSPRRAASYGSATTSRRHSGPDRPHRDALATGCSTRLAGRYVTDPSCGSSSNLFDLANAGLVARRAGLAAGSTRRSCRRSSSREPSWAAVTAEAAEATGLRAGHAGRGRRSGHAARTRRDRRGRSRSRVTARRRKLLADRRS